MGTNLKKVEEVRNNLFTLHSGQMGTLPDERLPAQAYRSHSTQVRWGRGIYFQGSD